MTHHHPDHEHGPRRFGGERRGFFTRAGRGGFTLVELVAVMIMLGVIGIATALSLDAMPANRRAAAARQVQRDLEFARERAMATGVTHWFVVSTGTNSYSILMEDPLDPGRAGATTIIDPARRAPFVQRFGHDEFAGASLGSADFDGASEVGFDWLGRALATDGDPLSANGTVTMIGGLSVFVLAGTGMVTDEAP